MNTGEGAIPPPIRRILWKFAEKFQYQGETTIYYAR
jgi:hypothetical protein